MEVDDGLGVGDVRGEVAWGCGWMYGGLSTHVKTHNL